MKITKEQAEKIAGGASVPTPDGGFIRLIQEPDENTTLSDFDCYGRIEWTRNIGFGAVRPDTFDGCAEKLSGDSWNTLWWQPPNDTKEDRRRWHTDPEYRRTMRELVQNITDYGFMIYRLEYCRGVDAYGRPVCWGVSTLGGVEPLLSHDDVVELVLDLAAELDTEVAA